MSQLFLAAKEILDWLDAQSAEGCLIGGLAVQRWGEPRLTHDVDLTVLAGIGCEAKMVDILFQRLAPRVEGAREFALQYRVVFLRASNGVDVDVALGATSFEVESVGRATPLGNFTSAKVY